MAIKPNQLIGKEKNSQYIIKKEFTDRDFPKKEFFRLIEEIKEENANDKPRYHVLNYYGMGGIGKSTLLQEIKNIVRSQYTDIIYSFADLANVSFRNSGKLLLELTKSFSTSELIFHHFSLAYAIYFQKCNKDSIYNHEEHRIFNEDLGLVADFLSIMDGLGVLGIIPGVVNKIYALSYKRIHLDKELKEDLKKLELMDSSRIEKLLPAFFAYDLKKYMKQNNKENVIIFIDTFEALWTHGKNDITRFNQDLFIRELISHLPGVLFTICSREIIDWKNIDAEWESVLNPILLEKFSNVDAENFLIKCGIQEIDIRNKMIDVSLGHPYHLNLLVDTYAEMKNTGIVPESKLFAANSRAILESFFLYLQTDEIAIIKIISIARMYDYGLFKYLLAHFPTGYPVTMFEEFNKFSFINHLGNGYYHIHEIMRKDISRVISPQLLNDVHKCISEYYISLIQENSFSYEKIKVFTNECIYHLGKYLTKDDFAIFVKKNFFSYFQAMQYQGESVYLLNVFANIYDYIDYDADIQLYEIYTDMIMLNGNFREAVFILDSFLKKYSLIEISNNQDILHLYVKKLKHQMVFIPLQDTIQALETILPFLDCKTFPHQYLELLYTKGNMLLEQGNYEECKKLFDYILHVAELNHLKDIKCRVLRKISDYYLTMNDVYNADLSCVNGIKIAEEFSYHRYKNYLECTQAEIYRKLKLFEKAKKKYKDCQETFCSLGINPWIAHTELGLAMIDLEQNQFCSMMEHLETAKKIYVNWNHEWGIIHVNLISLQGKYKQSQQIEYEQVLNLKKKCNSMGYLSTLQALEALENDKILSSNLLFL